MSAIQAVCFHDNAYLDSTFRGCKSQTAHPGQGKRRIEVAFNPPSLVYDRYF
jgi:hypothetical protein